MSESHWRCQLDDRYAEPESPASRRLACLLGGAIGDALGYRVEFMHWDAIERKYGAAGITLAAATGELVVSDDTQMTLFTLEGMARAAERGTSVIEEIRQAYLTWYRTQTERWRVGVDGDAAGIARHSVLWQAQAPGSTCLSALRHGGQGSVEQRINNSKGCGGVMRVAPLGFLGDSVSDAELFRLGVESAALTHGHPDGFVPSGTMAVLVRDALRQEPWEESVAKVQALLHEWPEGSGTIAAIEAAVAAASRGAGSRARVAGLGRGWVGEEALAIGVYCARVARSFAECIELAANHDGDSDSTASVAGQLYGARYGISALPREAVERIDVLEPLLEVWARWEGRLRPAKE